MSASQKHILVVEDDFYLRDLIIKKLEQKGYMAIGVIDAEGAFKELSGDHKKIDLILLDLLLPGMSGQELLRKLKDKDSWKDIPVIIVSNLDNPEDREQLLHLGAIDYMIKSQHVPEEIIERIENTLDQE